VLYLIGAIVMTGVIAAIVFVALHAGQVYKPEQHATRYGLRLGLGLAMLLAGAFYWRRRRRPPDSTKTKKEKGPGWLARMTASPSGKAAFLVGLIVYSPSITFIAAVQVVATAKASLAASVGALAIVIAITVVLVWLPLVFFIITPDRTGRSLARFNEWLRTHGNLILIGALVVGGVLLTIDGILGLTGVVS
jgi:hypothetical protein